MAKLVIKITVLQSVDPDLYDSISHMPLRQRSAVIRRYWRHGLQGGSQEIGSSHLGGQLFSQSVVEIGTVASVGHGPGSAGGELLRKDLNGQSLSGLSAFV